MSKLSKEEKEEYENFINFSDDLSEFEIAEIEDNFCDDEVVTPPDLLESYFNNIPSRAVFLYLTINPISNECSEDPEENHPYIAHLTYDPKNDTFEHDIINPSYTELPPSRTQYWEDYVLVLPLGEVIEIYSQLHGKGKKKLRYYIVSDQSENGIKKISKRKAYKMAVVRADIVRILSH